MDCVSKILPSSPEWILLCKAKEQNINYFLGTFSQEKAIYLKTVYSNKWPSLSLEVIPMGVLLDDSFSTKTNLNPWERIENLRNQMSFIQKKLEKAYEELQSYSGPLPLEAQGYLTMLQRSTDTDSTSESNDLEDSPHQEVENNIENTSEPSSKQAEPLMDSETPESSVKSDPKEVLSNNSGPDIVQDTFVEARVASELVERVLLLVQVESYLENCSEPEEVAADSQQEQNSEDSQKYQSPKSEESKESASLQSEPAPLPHHSKKDSSLSTLPPQQLDVEAHSEVETPLPPTGPSQTTQPSSFTKDDTSLNIKPKKKGRPKK